VALKYLGHGIIVMALSAVINFTVATLLRRPAVLNRSVALEDIREFFPEGLKETTTPNPVMSFANHAMPYGWKERQNEIIRFL
jgi:hypothetical protein